MEAGTSRHDRRVSMKWLLYLLLVGLVVGVVVMVVRKQGSAA